MFIHLSLQNCILIRTRVKGMSHTEYDNITSWASGTGRWMKRQRNEEPALSECKGDKSHWTQSPMTGLKVNIVALGTDLTRWTLARYKCTRTSLQVRCRLATTAAARWRGGALRSQHPPAALQEPLCTTGCILRTHSKLFTQVIWITAVVCLNVGGLLRYSMSLRVPTLHT